MKSPCCKCGAPPDKRTDKYCRDCRRDYTNQWRADNPERHQAMHLASSKRWNSANPEVVRKARRDYYHRQKAQEVAAE